MVTEDRTDTVGDVSNGAGRFAPDSSGKKPHIKALICAPFLVFVLYVVPSRYVCHLCAHIFAPNLVFAFLLFIHACPHVCYYPLGSFIGDIYFGSSTFSTL